MVSINDELIQLQTIYKNGLISDEELELKCSLFDISICMFKNLTAFGLEASIGKTYIKNILMNIFEKFDNTDFDFESYMSELLLNEIDNYNYKNYEDDSLTYRLMSLFNHIDNSRSSSRFWYIYDSFKSFLNNYLVNNDLLLFLKLVELFHISKQYPGMDYPINNCKDYSSLIIDYSLMSKEKSNWLVSESIYYFINNKTSMNQLINEIKKVNINAKDIQKIISLILLNPKFKKLIPYFANYNDNVISLTKDEIDSINNQKDFDKIVFDY